MQLKEVRKELFSVEARALGRQMGPSSAASGASPFVGSWDASASSPGRRSELVGWETGGHSNPDQWKRKKPYTPRSADADRPLIPAGPTRVKGGPRKFYPLEDYFRSSYPSPSSGA